VRDPRGKGWEEKEMRFAIIRHRVRLAFQKAMVSETQRERGLR